MNIQSLSEKTWEIIKWHKRYVVAAVILLVFVVRWYFLWSTTTTTAVIQTYSVTSGSIENTLKLIWTTKITNMQTLVFWAEGKVKAIYVKEGDKVKAGQLLAEIDKKSLSISLSQQALSIQNARINYNKLLTQYTDADKLKAQNDVTDMQNKLKIAKQQLLDLQSARWTTVQISSPKIQNIVISTRNYINSSKTILNHIDEVFYITKNNTLYQNVQINISAKNSAAISSIDNWFYQETDKLNQLSTKLSWIVWQSSVEMTVIQDLQNSTKDFLNSLSSLAISSTTAAQNTITSVDLSQADINGWVSRFTSDNATVLSLLSSVNTNILDLQNTANDIPTKQNEINNDQAQLQILQQTVQDMENWPKSNDRILQSNAIKQSQLSYQQTAQQLDNYQIVAPFDGTIDTIWFKVGDTVSYSAGSSTNGITVSNPDAYEVNTLIDQIDIVKVIPGQPVEITFDAYPGFSITWTIASIDPTPVTSAGVVSYKAKIILQQITGKKIYDSMSANVKVIIDHKDNILVIPTIAIQTSGDNTFVWTQQGTKDISIGITDGTQTEILSWLQAGDIVSAQAYQVQAAAKSTNPFQSTKTTGTWSSWQSQNKSQSFRMLQGAGGPGN